MTESSSPWGGVDPDALDAQARECRKASRKYKRGVQRTDSDGNDTWRSQFKGMDDGLYCFNERIGTSTGMTKRYDVWLRWVWRRLRLAAIPLRGSGSGHCAIDRVPPALAAPAVPDSLGRVRIRRFSDEHLSEVAAEIAKRKELDDGPAPLDKPMAVHARCDACTRQHSPSYEYARRLICGGLVLGDMVLHFCWSCARSFYQDGPVDIRELSPVFHRKAR